MISEAIDQSNKVNESTALSKNKDQSSNVINHPVVGEFSKIAHFISDMSWYMAVPLIAHSLGYGYTISRDLSHYNAEIPSSSLISGSRFNCIGDIITSSVDNGGLGLDWNEWLKNLKAFSYRNNFGVYYDDRDTVLSEVERVVSEIGKEPQIISEYYQVRDGIIFSDKDKRINDTESRAEAAEKYKAFLIARIERLSSELKSVKNDRKKQVDDARKEAQQVAESFFEDEISALKGQLEEFSESYEQIRGERDYLKESVDNLSDENASLKASNEAYRLSIDNYQARESEYLEKIESIQSEIETYKEKGTLSHNQLEINSLISSLEEKESELKTIRSDNKKLEIKRQKLVGRINNLKSKLSTMNKSLNKEKARSKHYRKKANYYFSAASSMNKQWNIMFGLFCITASFAVLMYLV